MQGFRRLLDLVFIFVAGWMGASGVSYYWLAGLALLVTAIHSATAQNMRSFDAVVMRGIFYTYLLMLAVFSVVYFVFGWLLG